MDFISTLVGAAAAPAPVDEGWYVVDARAPVVARPGGDPTGVSLAAGERVFVVESEVAGAGAYARLFRGGWVDASGLRAAPAPGSSSSAKGRPNAEAFATDLDDEVSPDMAALVRTCSIGSPPGFLDGYDGPSGAGWYAAREATPVLASFLDEAAATGAIEPGDRVFVVLAKEVASGRRARLLGGGWCDQGALARLDDAPPEARAWPEGVATPRCSLEDDGASAVGWFADGDGRSVFVAERLDGGRLKLIDGSEVDAAALAPVAALRRTASIKAFDAVRCVAPGERTGRA